MENNDKDKLRTLDPKQLNDRSDLAFRERAYEAIMTSVESGQSQVILHHDPEDPWKLTNIIKELVQKHFNYRPATDGYQILWGENNKSNRTRTVFCQGCSVEMERMVLCDTCSSRDRERKHW